MSVYGGWSRRVGVGGVAQGTVEGEMGYWISYART